TVPVELWNSTQSAVSSNWVKPTAKVVTYSDGTREMTLDLQGADQGSMTAYLKNVSPSGSYDDAIINATDADGYPSQVTFSLSDSDISTASVFKQLYVKYFVDMTGFPFPDGHSIKQYLKIDWSTASEVVNTTALEAKQAEAQGLVSQTDKYTSASLTSLQNQITATAALLSSGTLTQSSVDSQLTALTTAIAELVVLVKEPTSAVKTETVPVELWNSTQSAVSSNWVKPTAKVVTYSDGTREMTLDLQGADQGSMTAYLKNVSPSGSYDDAIINATDADGYPSQVTFSLSDSDISTASVFKQLYVKYFVDMTGFPFPDGHSIKQYLKIDWSTASEVVNTTALEAKQAEAQGLVSQTDKYTSASLTSLQNQITATAALLSSGTLTQSSVDSQLTALTTAIAELVELAPEKVSEIKEGHVYASNFTFVKPGTSEASMMDTYTQKPLYITKESGQLYLYITLTNPEYYQGIQFFVNGQYQNPTVISETSQSIAPLASALDSNNTGTKVIKTAVDTIDSPTNLKIHVVVPAINYDHEYDVQLVLDLNSLTDVTDNAPAYIGQSGQPNTDMNQNTNNPVADNGQAYKPTLLNNQTATATRNVAATSNPSTATQDHLLVYLIGLVTSTVGIGLALLLKRNSKKSRIS
ncbi:NEAT domain-containing protein, partial [Enterococcus sp. MMGLQ5-1]